MISSFIPRATTNPRVNVSIPVVAAISEILVTGYRPTSTYGWKLMFAPGKEGVAEPDGGTAGVRVGVGIGVGVGVKTCVGTVVAVGSAVGEAGGKIPAQVHRKSAAFTELVDPLYVNPNE